jgi:hypothetical protein
MQTWGQRGRQAQVIYKGSQITNFRINTPDSLSGRTRFEFQPATTTTLAENFFMPLQSVIYLYPVTLYGERC